MKQSQVVAKNLFLVLSSDAIGYGINFLVVILTARYLGVAGFGEYSFIMAFSGVFQTIANWGFSNIMVREISVNKKDLARQLGVTKPLIWIFSVLIFALIALVINLVNPEAAVKNAIYIMGFSVFTMVHSSAYGAVFTAMEEMQYTAIGVVSYRLVLLALVLGVILAHKGIVELAIAYAMAGLFLWSMYYLMVSKRYSRPKMLVDMKAWRYYIKEAFPLGAATILRRVSWKLDIVILTLMSSMSSVSFFSAPYKIIEALNLLPFRLTIPLYPVFSRLARTSHEALFRAYEKNLKFIFMAAVPVTVLLYCLSGRIILSVYGARFAPSAAALRILALALLFIFPSAQFLYLFSSLGRQKLYAVSSLICVAVNVLLDLALIPRFDFIGACIATLAAEAILLAAGVYFIKSQYKNVFFSFLRPIMKPVLSGIVMWAVILLFKGNWQAVGAAAGLAAYLACNIAMRTFSRGEVREVARLALFFRNRKDVVAQ